MLRLIAYNLIDVRKPFERALQEKGFHVVSSYGIPVVQPIGAPNDPSNSLALIDNNSLVIYSKDWVGRENLRNRSKLLKLADDFSF